MATPIKCVSTIVWKGKFRRPGETIPDMDDAEAKRLAAMGACVISNAKKGDAPASTDAPSTPSK